jgi:lysophospholipase L1-like esterase
MEIIGDSITAGYGDEGVSPCSFSAETENHFLTYGAVAARSVGAELHTVAWSGKGIVYNYGDDMTEPLPDLYDRTIATEGAAWDFSWQPDVVVINLGTNDFSTDNDPPQELYVGHYVDFLAHLRDVYPGAFILIVAPSLYGAEVALVEGYLLDVVAQRQAAGDPDVAFADINVTWDGSGCDGHPNVATHAGMADRLVEQLQLHLGW